MTKLYLEYAITLLRELEVNYFLTPLGVKTKILKSIFNEI